jgi:hypothetical protein
MALIVVLVRDVLVEERAHFPLIRLRMRMRMRC